MCPCRIFSGSWWTFRALCNGLKSTWTKLDFATHYGDVSTRFCVSHISIAHFLASFIFLNSETSRLHFLLFSNGSTGVTKTYGTTSAISDAPPKPKVGVVVHSLFVQFTDQILDRSMNYCRFSNVFCNYLYYTLREMGKTLSRPSGTVGDGLL